MSLIGIKDLDYLLADRLDDRSIFNLQQTNQYYYKLFDDKYYLKRYLKKYGDLLSNKLDLKKIKITKELYFENQKYLNHLTAHFMTKVGLNINLKQRLLLMK